MAYDPEARESSNSAMIIGIVALVLVVGAVLAYWATRPRDEVAVVNPGPTIVQQPASPTPDTVVVTPPATNPDTVVVERPVAVPQTRTIERNTRTETTRVVPVPQGSSAGGGTSAAPNVTVNTNVEPPAGASGSNGSGGAATGSGGATGGPSSDAAGSAGTDTTGGAGGNGAAGSSELPPPAQ
jgi:hypothetical protein